MPKIFMRRATKLACIALLSTMLLAGIASAGKAPYIMTFYDEAGEAVGWQVGSCSGQYSFYGTRTDDYTIEYLNCHD